MEYVHEDPKGRRWLVNPIWADIGGRQEPIAVTVSAYAGDAPVTAEVLRSVPLGTVVAVLRRERARLWQKVVDEGRRPEGTAGTDEEWSAVAGSRAEGFAGPHRGRRLGTDELQVVADAYLAAWRDGRPVVEAVVEACVVSQSTANKRIRAARDLGLLPAKGERQ